MMTDFKVKKFPKSRLATLDIAALGLKKHHIAAMIEVDVSKSRAIISKRNGKASRISFTAWLIKVISTTIKEYEQAAAYLGGKRKILIFNDINVSLLVEKMLDGHRIPIPIVIEKANEKSAEAITRQIRAAKEKELTDSDIVLQKRTGPFEQLYYLLPGFARRFFWKFLLGNPRLAFSKMGNVSFTSIGMMGGGNLSGWFIPISVHPICFGISSITKKPVVIDQKIVIREVLDLTILLDHDVIDGAPMARLIHQLSENIEEAREL